MQLEIDFQLQMAKISPEKAPNLAKSWFWPPHETHRLLPCHAGDGAGQGGRVDARAHPVRNVKARSGMWTPCLPGVQCAMLDVDPTQMQAHGHSGEGTLLSRCAFHVGKQCEEMNTAVVVSDPIVVVSDSIVYDHFCTISHVQIKNLSAHFICAWGHAVLR